MNRSLQDPFQSTQLPEQIEEFLDDGNVTCLAFNRWGTLLAGGTEDGKIIIWENEVRGVAKVLEGHGGRVSSLQWSRKGDKLVSGGQDKRVILWDVLSGSKVQDVELQEAVSTISISPREPTYCIASLHRGPPVRVEFANRTSTTLPLVSDGRSRAVSTSAIVHKDGRLLFCGQSKGLLTVLDVTSLQFYDVVKIPGQAHIVGLEANRKGRLLLVNCSDRVIRLYSVSMPGEEHRPLPVAEVQELLAQSAWQPVRGRAGSLLHSADGGAGSGAAVLVLEREYQNAVERTPWRAVCFSNDSEHVVGASGETNQHNLYIWSSTWPKLDRILEGPKLSVVALAWHPIRSMLYTVCSEGMVYLWAAVYQESWSAFAPDFKELEENVEYVEKETEFDCNPDSDAAAAGPEELEEEEEGEELDIETLPQTVAWFSSDDEDDADGLQHLPVVITEETGDGEDGDEDDNEEEAEDDDMEEEEEEEEEGDGVGDGRGGDPTRNLDDGPVLVVDSAPESGAVMNGSAGDDGASDAAMADGGSDAALAE